jgi:hypothetical protein
VSLTPAKLESCRNVRHDTGHVKGQGEGRCAPKSGLTPLRQWRAGALFSSFYPQRVKPLYFLAFIGVCGMFPFVNTNDFILTVTSPVFWGQGSEWFWAFLQFVVVALTLGVITYQVWSQTQQAKIQAAGAMAATVSLIQDKWNTETMQRIRLKICSEWKNNKKNFDGVGE